MICFVLVSMLGGDMTRWPMPDALKTAIPLSAHTTVQPIEPKQGSPVRAKILTSRGASYEVAETRDQVLTAPCYVRRDSKGDVASPD